MYIANTECGDGSNWWVEIRNNDKLSSEISKFETQEDS